MLVGSFFDWLGQNATALLDVVSMGLGLTAIIVHKIGKVQHRVLIDDLQDNVDQIRRQLNGVQPQQRGPGVVPGPR